MAKHILSIVFCTLILFTLTILLLFVQVTPYTNRTESQAQAQADRYFSLQVAACNKAGGNWSTTMTAAGCNVTYPQPSMSGFVDPIPNPAYPTWQIVQPGLILGAIIDGIVLFALLAMLIEDRRMSRGYLQVERPGRLFRRRRPGSEGAPGEHRRL